MQLHLFQQVITLLQLNATAAKVATEKAAYYDRDGNKIAENALDDYFLSTTMEM